MRISVMAAATSPTVVSSATLASSFVQPAASCYVCVHHDAAQAKLDKLHAGFA
jgi:hypothetical protein